MIIVGNRYIKSEILSCINSVEDINNTKPNSVVVFRYDIDIIKYCYDNSVKMGVLIQNITQAVFCNSLDVYYIITQKDISQDIQNLAQNYMFDSKVLEVIDETNDIQDVALKNIDGVVYKKLLGDLI